MQDVYTENYKILLREIKDLNKWRYTTFTYKISLHPIVILQIQCNPDQNFSRFFCCGGRNDQVDSKMDVEMQTNKKSQNNFEK